MMQRTLIAFVVEATSGGTKRHVVDALEGLASDGWRCLLLHADHRSDRRFAHERGLLARLGVDCQAIEMPHGPSPTAALAAGSRAASLIARSAQGAPVVVHGHSSLGGVVARAASVLLRLRGGRIRCVYTPHCPITMSPFTGSAVHGVYLLAESVLACATDAIVAVGREEAAHLRRWPGARRRVVTIPNGISTRPLMVAGTRREGVLWVGRLSRQKDPLAAIRIAARLPGARLTMVGDGELRIDAERAARGAEGRVLLAGWQDDIDPWYRSAAAVLVTSVYEGFPYSVLEAMAAGCPVIGFRCPGVSELLAGTGNLLLDREDPQATDRITRFLARTDLPAIGADNQNLVGQRYSLRLMTSRLDLLYRRLLA